MASDAYIRREGELYGISPDEYLNMSPVLRVSTRSKWMRELRKEAAEKGLDAEQYLVKKQTEIQDTLRDEFPDEAPAAPAVPAAPLDSSTRVNHVPVHPAIMPRRVNTTVPDLVGDRTPRTLADIYARWPVGKQEGYYLRVERVQPRFFQNVPCSGYVGQIHVELSEQDFGQYFGGREYLIEVYGPDPRRQDAEGTPVVKRLSDPIKLSVPIAPPNLAAGDVRASSSGETPPMYPHQMYQFPQQQSVQPQPSQADVQMHRSTLEVLGNMLVKTQEKQERAAAAQGEVAGGVLQFVKSSNQDQLALIREQLQAEREQKKLLEARLEKATDPTAEMIKALAPNKDAAIDSLRQSYDAQLLNLRTMHETLDRTTSERHAAEMRRADERYAELKGRYDTDLVAARQEGLRQVEQMRDQYARDLESLRRDYESRERALRDEIRDVRSELRLDADKRIAELKETHASKVEDLEKSFQRELRSVKESNETRLHVTDQTRQTEITILREKLGEKEQELAKLRMDLERLGDPIEQIKAMEEKAQALGYTKNDPAAPSGPWEHLAASVGAGVGQMLGSVGEWGPSLLERMQAGQAQRQQLALQQQALMLQAQQQPQQLPAGAPGAPGAPGGGAPGQQTAQNRPAARRATRWATENSSLATRPATPDSPMGFQPLPEQAPAPAPEAKPAPTPEQEAPTPEQSQGGMPTEEQLAQIMPPLPPELQKFSLLQVYGFMMSAEEQMRAAMPPATFLEHFAAAYPDQARMAFETGLPAFDKYIRSIEGLQGSTLHSRGGQQWLEKLWVAMQQKFKA